MNLGDPVVTSRSKILQGPVSLLQYIFRFLLAIAWGMILGCTPLCLSLSLTWTKAKSHIKQLFPSIVQYVQICIINRPATKSCAGLSREVNCKSPRNIELIS